jgi:hypothetical protein
MLSLPALSALRLYDQEATWTLAGNPEILRLLKDRFYPKKILSLQQKEWALLYQEETPPFAPFSEFLRAFQKIILFSAADNDPLVRGLGRVGVKDILWIPSFPDVQAKISLNHRQRTILESKGIPWLEKEINLFPASGDMEEAGHLLQPFQGSGTFSFWAVHPGSGSIYKNWPLERFLETAKQLENRLQLRPLFLLGPVEEERTPLSIQSIRAAGFPLIENLPLSVLAAVLSHCRGYIGNDSGISHLAAALGIPTLVLFGPTDPLLWAPQGKKVTVLSPTLSCAPCSPENMASCLQKQCLESIPVFRVVEAVAVWWKIDGQTESPLPKVPSP